MNPARVNASAPPASASTYVCRFSGRNALSTSRFSQLECALWSFQLGSHRFHQDWDRGRSPPFQKRKKKRSGRKSQTYITSLNCFLYTIIKMLFSSFLFPKSISNFGVFSKWTLFLVRYKEKPVGILINRSVYFYLERVNGVWMQYNNLRTLGDTTSSIKLKKENKRAYWNSLAGGLSCLHIYTVS